MFSSSYAHRWEAAHGKITADSSGCMKILPQAAVGAWNTSRVESGILFRVEWDGEVAPGDPIKVL